MLRLNRQLIQTSEQSFPQVDSEGGIALPDYVVNLLPTGSCWICQDVELLHGSDALHQQLIWVSATAAYVSPILSELTGRNSC